MIVVELKIKWISGEIRAFLKCTFHWWTLETSSKWKSFLKSTAICKKYLVKFSNFPNYSKLWKIRVPGLWPKRRFAYFVNSRHKGALNSNKFIVLTVTWTYRFIIKSKAEDTRSALNFKINWRFCAAGENFESENLYSKIKR